jgi:RNA polymerase sigma-70 factor (ECF subfamily)
MHAAPLPASPSFEEEVRMIETIRTHKDVDLYALLVDRYKDRLFRAVWYRVRDRETAEDIAQDTFVKAYLSLDDFRGESRFYSWLCRIAINKSQDWARHQKMVDQHGAFLEPQSPVTPEQECCRRELAARIEAALMELPEHYREAFYLKHVDERSYEEMARMLNLSKGALKVRVHRARLMLQGLLQEDAL